MLGMAFEQDLYMPVRSRVDDHIRQTGLCQRVQMDFRLFEYHGRALGHIK